MFNNLRLAYLDELENDPEVAQALEGLNKVILGPKSSDRELIDAVRPLYNKEVTVFYGDPSDPETQYEDSGILLDPTADYPGGLIKYGMEWDISGLSPTAIITKTREPNHVEYLENLNTVAYTKDWIVEIDYSKGIIYLGPESGSSDHV